MSRWGVGGDEVVARLASLEAGQTNIVGRIEALATRDQELESKISAAVDRMTVEMVKQSADFREAIERQTDALRESLLETRIRRRLIVISGRGLKWAERGLWTIGAAVGWKLWSIVAHAHGWDDAWWWPW